MNMANFETVEVSTDLLILGGGFSACGAATEAAYWAKKNGLKITLVDKAALDRSGAVAMGLSAINQYVGVRDGENTVEDYVRYVRQDLMGISRGVGTASSPRDAGSVAKAWLLISSWDGYPPNGSAVPSGVVLVGNLNRLMEPSRNFTVHMMSSVPLKGVALAPMGTKSE
jgi:hypothetical protein